MYQYKGDPLYKNPLEFRGTWRKAQMLDGNRGKNGGWHVLAGPKEAFCIVAYCEYEEVADLIIEAGNK
jgi:succinyl-CoA synthetase beta subunit